MPLNTLKTGECIQAPVSQGQEIQVSCMWQAQSLFPHINLQMLCPHIVIF